MKSRTLMCMTAMTLFAALAIPVGLAAQTPILTVLHTFAGGADGAYPRAGLVRDASGNFYGTTEYGGNGGCNDGAAAGCGTVFKLSNVGKETVFHNFTGGATDGAYPFAGVILDGAGNVYGTTNDGGAVSCVYGQYGCGVVFKLDSGGNEAVLHLFTGTQTDGAHPFGGLFRDRAGNLYGTNYYGGSSNDAGTVFKLSTAGREKILYSFTGGTDGGYPWAGLTPDAAGNLYGTSEGGGVSCFYGVCGTVFKLDRTGKETVLYSFTGGADGFYPAAGLIRDAAGNLYGTTYGGGIGNCAYACGLVFKLDPNDKETVLYSFGGGTDGASPNAALVRDAAGNLYGTTTDGGTYGYGVVFKLDTTGKETVLHSFTGGTDGAYPQYGSLLRDAAGNLYGTTFEGGDVSCGSGTGCGVVFKVAP